MLTSQTTRAVFLLVLLSVIACIFSTDAALTFEPPAAWVGTGMAIPATVVPVHNAATPFRARWRFFLNAPLPSRDQIEALDYATMIHHSTSPETMTVVYETQVAVYPTNGDRPYLELVYQLGFPDQAAKTALTNDPDDPNTRVFFRPPPIPEQTWHEVQLAYKASADLEWTPQSRLSSTKEFYVPTQFAARFVPNCISQTASTAAQIAVVCTVYAPGDVDSNLYVGLPQTSSAYTAVTQLTLVTPLAELFDLRHTTQQTISVNNTCANGYCVLGFNGIDFHTPFFSSKGEFTFSFTFTRTASVVNAIPQMIIGAGLYNYPAFNTTYSGLMNGDQLYQRQNVIIQYTNSGEYYDNTKLYWGIRTPEASTSATWPDPDTHWINWLEVFVRVPTRDVGEAWGMALISADGARSNVVLGNSCRTIADDSTTSSSGSTSASTTTLSTVAQQFRKAVAPAAVANPTSLLLKCRIVPRASAFATATDPLTLVKAVLIVDNSAGPDQSDLHKYLILGADRYKPSAVATIATYTDAALPLAIPSTQFNIPTLAVVGTTRTLSTTTTEFRLVMSGLVRPNHKILLKISSSTTNNNFVLTNTAPQTFDVWSMSGLNETTLSNLAFTCNLVDQTLPVNKFFPLSTTNAPHILYACDFPNVFTVAQATVPQQSLPVIGLGQYRATFVLKHTMSDVFDMTARTLQQTVQAYVVEPHDVLVDPTSIEGVKPDLQYKWWQTRAIGAAHTVGFASNDYPVRVSATVADAPGIAPRPWAMSLSTTAPLSSAAALSLGYAEHTNFAITIKTLQSFFADAAFTGTSVEISLMSIVTTTATAAQTPINRTLSQTNVAAWSAAGAVVAMNMTAMDWQAKYFLKVEVLNAPEVTEKGAYYSTMFKIAQPAACSGQCLNNGECNAFTGLCECPQGFSGDACEISFCDNCTTENTETCDAAAGLCKCTGAGTPEQIWGGKFCDVTMSCSEQGRAFCNNRGNFAPLGPELGCNEKQCQCNKDSFFTGARCQSCSLTCLQGGKADASCTSCICPAGYSGNVCQCSSLQTSITFNGLTHATLESVAAHRAQNGNTAPLPADLSNAFNFLQLQLRDNLAALININTTALAVSDVNLITSGDQTSIAISLRMTFGCGQVSSLTRSEVNAKWNAFRDNISGSPTLLGLTGLFTPNGDASAALNNLANTPAGTGNAYVEPVNPEDPKEPEEPEEPEEPRNNGAAALFAQNVVLTFAVVLSVVTLTFF